MRGRDRQGGGCGLLVVGYLSLWTAFGMAVHLGDALLHRAMRHNAWAIGTGILLLAGLYQFTPLKYVCLNKCRSPLSFITEHWRSSMNGSTSFGWVCLMGSSVLASASP
jgi:predicted metal-binding membrane protein